ncbi:sigma-70 family RNA polymerase sigma factor [Ureibacillus sp. Re31]|uniref:Sigma-70 family RNA polymerase sigma factor n=1 Tax=Ureibacillus galli TaxID=2762222 RepID=A0ABR8XA58_9BACL|nr:sigma-70 family RNA polymerase sigma factor [Ureibacillus galli]MBD8026062.1 sigma-70 family RNA polymerase sigma factor [Ureibacillus galli]
MRYHLEEIIELYGDYLLRIAYTYVKDQRIAEEMIQDVFLAYYKKRGQFRGEASLKTYLTKITVHRCTDYLRSWKNKKELLIGKFHIRGETKNIETKYIEKEEKMEVTEAVFSLNVKLREVLLFYYYAEHTTKEIAEILSIPESTIKSRLQKARTVLKEKLKGADLEVLLNGNE